LYDLPAVGSETNGLGEPGTFRGRMTQPSYFSQETPIRQPRPGRS